MKFTYYTLSTTLLALMVLGQGIGWAQGKKTDLRLDAVEQLLLDGQWARVTIEAQRAIEDITATHKERDGEIEQLGKLLGAKALAESNLDRLDDALWNWQVAETLLNRQPVQNPGQFGNAGFLEGKNRSYLPSSVQAPSQPTAAEEEDRSTRFAEAVQPPFPRKLARKHKGGYIIVKVVVDQEGRLYRPQIEHYGPVKKMVVPALQTLRAWKIEPAIRDGRPIPVETTIRLDY